MQNVLVVSANSCGLNCGHEAIALAPSSLIIYQKTLSAAFALTIKTPYSIGLCSMTCLTGKSLRLLRCERCK